MTKEQCKSCNAAVLNGAQIECHAKPPLVTPVVGPNKLGQPTVLASITSFPQVQPDQWCREWAAGEELTLPAPPISRIVIPNARGRMHG